MNDADAAFLAGLPGMAFGFALVLVRVSGAVMLLPGLGEAELPATVRAAVSVALTLLLLPVVLPLLPGLPAAPLGVMGLVLAELAVGLWLGWLARLAMLALPLAGQMAAALLGMTNVLQPDPTLGPQTAALSRLFGTAAPVLLFAAGLHRLPILALAGSYRTIAPGHVLPAGDLAQAAVAGVGGCFALALQLAAPFILAGAVWQLGLGMLARLVPQLQVYFAAMPGQLLGGFVLLASLSSAVMLAWRDAAGGVLAALPGL